MKIRITGRSLPKAQTGGQGTTTYQLNGMTLDPNNPEHAAIIKQMEADNAASHADIPIDKLQ